MDDGVYRIDADVMAEMVKLDQEQRAEIARLRTDFIESTRLLGEKAEEVVRLKAVIKKHYPTIAGHVMRLQEGHESRAAAEWEWVAHDFAGALGLGQ